MAGAATAIPPPANADHPTSAPYVSDSATSMVVGEYSVDYASYTGCAGDEFPDTCRVRTVSSEGEHRPEWQLLRWSFPERTDAIASNLAAAGAYFYWVDKAGRLVRVWSPSIRAETTTVATLRDPAAATEVAADDQYIYWIENSRSGEGRLYRTRGPGVTPELLVHNPRAHLHQLTADGFGGVLYTTTHLVALICCVDMLERVTTDASGAVVVDRTDVQAVQAFAVGERGSVYFIDTLARGGPKLRETYIGDLRADRVVAELDGTDSPAFRAMTVGGGNVFFQPVRTGRGPIMRMPTPGGPVVPVTATSLPRVDQFGANDHHLFALAATDIFRLPLAGVEVLLDIDGSRGPEVVQIIQSDAHDVPVVAGKRTFVRVYGRLASAPPGQTSLALNPPVLLYGTRDGAPLPGSPLRPIEVKPITDVAIDRTNQETTFLFDLPYSWRFGTVTLRSAFNESRSLVERDHTNNGATRTVAFRETGGVCLDMLPVLTQAGVSESAWSSQIEPHFRRALSLYPVDRLYPIWRGGTARTIPGTFGDHYNMFDGDHKNLLMMNLNAELGHQGAPAGCRGNKLIRTVLVPDSNRFGQSSGIGPYIYALRSFDSDPVQNEPHGGVLGLAHEVGHQHGFAHVRCPVSGPRAPGWPYESWPYATTCQIDDRNDHIGFDVLTRELVVPFDAAGMPTATDFNSYGPRPQWTSRYTFDKIFSQHAGGVSVPPSGGSGAAGTFAAAEDTPSDNTSLTDDKQPPSADPPGDTAKVVVGFIDGTGTAMMAHVNTASGPPLAALRDRLKAAAAASDTYELRTYDAAGTLLHAEPLTVGMSSDEGDGPSFEFVHLVEEDPAIARIAVFDTQSGAELVARHGGDHAPAVEIDAPTVGDVVGDDMRVAWTSSDADGDDVVHLVRYSTDGGATWQVVTSGLLGDHVAVDLRQMPGSTDGFVEVIASDGVHSTAASVGPFVVPTKAPSATIMTDTFDELDALTGATTRQSGHLVLQGRGYDAEDGLLEGGALVWRLAGPIDVTAEGDEIVLSDLPPGRYGVTLKATDADGNTGVAETALEVLPKQVDGAAPPDVDGACDDAGYLHDDDPIVLRHGSATLSNVAMVHSGGDLYACASGLLGDDQLGASFTLRLDPDASGGPVPEGTDLILRVGQNGLVDVAVGDGKGGMAPVADPDGIAVAVAPGGQRWQAEVRLQAALLGQFGPLLRVRAAQQDVLKSGGDAWPVRSEAGVPDTWGLATTGGDVPPVLTVPVNGLTVPAASPAGAIVDYDVSVTDGEDPKATVSCQPPSGTLFPIGTTTVTCVGRDAAGNQTVSTFDVRVVPTERVDKQAVRDTLAALLPTGDAANDDAIKQAIAYLDQALDPALWADGDRLDAATGKTVFDSEAAAVEVLAQMAQPPPDAAAAITELVDVDADLAATAIGDAEAALADNAGGDATALDKAAKELAKAHREVVAAEDERDRGQPRQAIIRYRQAWQFATRALDWALTAG